MIPDMAALLFTECLQVDFIKPLGPHDALPNALHVGFMEARRLLGEDVSSSPIRRFLGWAHGRAGKDLRVVHVRDWHDLTDAGQRSHLDQFGAHCIQGTPGAEFVFEVPSKHDEVFVVDATTLNDFKDTNLPEFVQPFAHGPCRAGIAGVWTEAKVFFLAYELRSRYTNFEIGVCSALCASSSRAEHYHALEQLVRVLGAKVFTSVGQFSEWLAGERVEMALPQLDLTRPRLTFEPRAQIEPVDEQLVRYLFRDCSNVKLKVLGGGFSGNVVLGATGTDLEGHQQVTHVVKIGPQAAVGQERAHFERIEAVLGNSAPQITQFADLGDRGALKYRYAAMGGGFSSTFQQRFAAGLPFEQTARILDAVFEQQLGRLYAAKMLEPCNLLQEYGFSAQWAPGVRRAVEQLLGEGADGETIPIRLDPGAERSVSVPNLCHFYEQVLPQLPTDRRERTHRAFVHGDLNGANIVVDAQENVWLIDFFHTRRAHVLMDLIKLENDLLYIMTPLESEADLLAALQLTDALLEVRDLRAPPALVSRVQQPALRRTAQVIERLRSYYPNLVETDRSVLQLLVGQLRYAVHTLSFDEPSRLQKLWALYAASQTAACIARYYAESAQLRIDWLPKQYTPFGQLGLTLLPGRRDLGRDLATDLQALKQQGVTHVVCLLSDDELSRYGAGDLIQQLHAAGVSVLQLPIVDQAVCTRQEADAANAFIDAALFAGGRVMIHCVAGLGRSGLIAACYLRHAHQLSGGEAIAVVRESRSERAVETQAQVDFVETFGDSDASAVTFAVF